MAVEVEELRRKLEALPRVGKRRIYTATLKRQILETVDLLIADEMTQAHACEALGIHPGTVADWKRGKRRRGSASKKRGRVMPVEVTAPPSKAGLVMVLPGGARVEGLPKSALRKAIDYMLRYWRGLVAFVDDPHLDIDNNRTERVLRGVCLRRKNHYGSRSVRGTEVAAIFYSLVESAKLSGVEPAWYLHHAAEAAMAKPGAVLLPSQLSA